jgi:uncharacterized cupredoxin-like copper-binding protein
VCNLPGHYAAGMHIDFWVTSPGAVVTAELGKTSPQAMFIHPSSTTAPAGTVSFVVTNADKVRLTGNKLDEKVYRRHSGFPGGLKSVSAKNLQASRVSW